MARRAVLLAALGLYACADGDGIDPCAVPHACQVEGADLAFLDLAAEWNADQPVHGAFGPRLVPRGDSILMRLRVVNRGDTASAPATVVVQQASATFAASVTAGLPALEPGVVWRDSVWIVAPITLGLVTDTVAVRGSLVTSTGDAWPVNDSIRGPSYAIMAPSLIVRLRDVPDSIRALVPTDVGLILINRSRVIADSGMALHFCVPAAADGACSPGGPQGAPVILPRLLPGDSIDFDATATLGFELAPMVEPAAPVSISACAAEVDDLAALLAGVASCSPAVPVTIVQNLETACAPAHRRLPTRLFSGFGASRCEHRGTLWHVWTVDVDGPTAVEVVTVSAATPTLHAVDPHARPVPRIGNEFTLPAAGGYHFLFQSVGDTVDYRLRVAN